MKPATVIRYDDLEPNPWQNGLGVTRTIQSMADGGGWSLSIATIERSALFSIISGVQRVQLAIDAVRLVIDGTESRLDRGEQVRFTGEQSVSGASAGETSRVLNLMYAEGTPNLGLSIIRSAHGLPDTALAAVVLAGVLEVSGSKLGFLDSVILAPGGNAENFSGTGQIAVVHVVS